MKTVINVSIALAICAFVAGCGSADSRTEPEPLASDEVQLRFAGVDSQPYGVQMWELRKSGAINGLGVHGEVVAAFQSHANTRTVDSLNPGGGSRVYDEKAGIVDSFPAQTRAVYDAFLADAKANAPPQSRSKDLGDGVASVAQPAWVGPFACCFGSPGIYGNYWYWTDAAGHTTQYCHLDTWSNVPCSGLNSCINYGYSTGCLNWI